MTNNNWYSVIVCKLQCLTFILLEALLLLLASFGVELVGHLFVAFRPSLARDPPSATAEGLELPLMGLVLLWVHWHLLLHLHIVAAALGPVHLRIRVVRCFLPCPSHRGLPLVASTPTQVVEVSCQRLVFWLQATRYPSQAACITSRAARSVRPASSSLSRLGYSAWTPAATHLHLSRFSSESQCSAVGCGAPTPAHWSPRATSRCLSWSVSWRSCALADPSSWSHGSSLVGPPCICARVCTGCSARSRYAHSWVLLPWHRPCTSWSHLSSASWSHQCATGSRRRRPWSASFQRPEHQFSVHRSCFRLRDLSVS